MSDWSKKAEQLQRRERHYQDAREVLLGLAVVVAILVFTKCSLGEWRTYSPPGSVDNRGILQDVLSRLTPDRRQGAYESDPIGWCHEGTHYLNVQLDDACGPDSDTKSEHCAYVGGGRFMVLRHPRVRMSVVRSYVAPSMQGAFDSALCSWREYENEPLYILDEWTAYTNGSQACRELGSDAARRGGSDERAQWLGHFAEALVAAVKAYDPGYPQLSDLVEFVKWHRARVARVLGMAVISQVAQQTQCRWVWNGRQYVQVCDAQQRDAAGWASVSSPTQVATQPAAAQAPQPMTQPVAQATRVVPPEWNDPQWQAWRTEHDARIQRMIDASLETKLGGYVPLDRFNAATRTDDDGPLAGMLKAKLDVLLSTVEQKAGQKIDERLGPIDDKLNQVNGSLAGKIFGHAATLFGWTIPPQLAGLGVAAAPVALGLAAWNWWKGRKQQPTSTGSGGAGQPSFR
ncbi:MAG: hypothetical protein AB7U97_02740 [Pirellulales bacterium]